MCSRGEQILRRKQLSFPMVIRMFWDQLETFKTNGIIYKGENHRGTSDTISRTNKQPFKATCKYSVKV